MAYQTLYTPIPLKVERLIDLPRYVPRAKTASMELETGMQAPMFALPEPLTGKVVSLSDFDGAAALLVIIMCNHCPFVKMLKGMHRH